MPCNQQVHFLCFIYYQCYIDVVREYFYCSNLFVIIARGKRVFISLRLYSMTGFQQAPYVSTRLSLEGIVYQSYSLGLTSPQTHGSWPNLQVRVHLTSPLSIPIQIPWALEIPRITIPEMELHITAVNNRSKRQSCYPKK